jgi:hypothetical protein
MSWFINRLELTSLSRKFEPQNIKYNYADLFADSTYFMLHAYLVYLCFRSSKIHNMSVRFCLLITALHNIETNVCCRRYKVTFSY